MDQTPIYKKTISDLESQLYCSYSRIVELSKVSISAKHYCDALSEFRSLECSSANPLEINLAKHRLDKALVELASVVKGKNEEH